MATPSILIVPDRYKSGVLYSQLPETGAVDFDVTRATPAFRTNASGVLESVASGVPRLDYPAAGGCPSLLVEPAATNLLQRSEEFDNAYWSKNGTTASGNMGASPDGNTTADLIFPSASGSDQRLQRAISVVSGTTYTISIFAKASGLSWIKILEPQSFINGAWFDVANGVVGTIQGGLTASIQSFGNGWYRCSITRTVSATTTGQVYIQLTNNNNTSSVTANGTDGVLFWGAQLETGSVATSYIPTTSAAVTRNADVISKTGVSGFIGQTEGTLYAEVDLRALSLSRIFVSISDSSDTIESRIRIGILSNNIIYGQIGSVITNTITATTGVFKVAVAYNSAGFVVYVNGTSYGTETTATAGTKSVINLGSTQALANFLNDRIRAAAIYTTRLSNTDLAALTSL
jgi:hypothetical protein